MSDTKMTLVEELVLTLRDAKRTIQSLMNRLGGDEDFTDFDELLARAALAQPQAALPGPHLLADGQTVEGAGS